MKDENESLLGKQVRGFKFKFDIAALPSGAHYTYINAMDEYIDQVGVIILDMDSSVSIEFPDGQSWTYPRDLAKQHIIGSTQNEVEIFNLL